MECVIESTAHYKAKKPVSKMGLLSDVWVPKLVPNVDNLKKPSNTHDL